jgi:hypothetical protein
MFNQVTDDMTEDIVIVLAVRRVPKTTQQTPAGINHPHIDNVNN